MTKPSKTSPRAPIEQTLALIRENFPAQLLELPIWVMWELVANGDGKPKKIPYYASGVKRYGTLDTPADRKKLVTFERIALAWRKHPDMSGVGIALGRVGDMILCGIDLDHCIGSDGVLDERAAKVVARAAGAYVESSPSGDGLHIIGMGDIGNRKTPPFEHYSGERFFTVTGETWVDVWSC